MANDYSKNLFISIPADIVRHPDGSPMIGCSPEDKEKFREWVIAEEDGGKWYESLSIKEKEEMFLSWKNNQQIKK